MVMSDAAFKSHLRKLERQREDSKKRRLEAKAKKKAEEAAKSLEVKREEWQKSEKLRQEALTAHSVFTASAVKPSSLPHPHGTSQGNRVGSENKVQYKKPFSGFGKHLDVSIDRAKQHVLSLSQRNCTSFSRNRLTACSCLLYRVNEDVAASLAKSIVDFAKMDVSARKQMVCEFGKNEKTVVRFPFDSSVSSWICRNSYMNLLCVTSSTYYKMLCEAGSTVSASGQQGKRQAKDGDEVDTVTNGARLDDIDRDREVASNHRTVLAESQQNRKRKRTEHQSQASAAPNSNKRVDQDGSYDDDENDEPDDGGAFDLESDVENEIMTTEVEKDPDVAEERGETKRGDDDFPAINSAGTPPANHATERNVEFADAAASPRAVGASSGIDGFAAAPSVSTIEGTTIDTDAATAAVAVTPMMDGSSTQSMSYQEMVLFAAAVACVSPQVVEAFVDIANLREVSNGVVLSCGDMKKYIQFKPLYQEWQTSAQSTAEEPLPSPSLTSEESDIII